MFNPIEFARAEEALLKLRAAQNALARSVLEHEQHMVEIQRNHESLVADINAIISVANEAYEKSLHDILHERDLGEDAVRSLIAQRADTLIGAGLARIDVPIEDIRPQRRPGPARGTKRRGRSETLDDSLGEACSGDMSAPGGAPIAHQPNDPSESGNLDLSASDGNQHSHEGFLAADSARLDDDGGFDAIGAQNDSLTGITADPFNGPSNVHLVTTAHDSQEPDPLIASLLGTSNEGDDATPSDTGVPGVPADDEDWS